MTLYCFDLDFSALNEFILSFKPIQAIFMCLALKKNVFKASKWDLSSFRLVGVGWCYSFRSCQHFSKGPLEFY